MCGDEVGVMSETGEGPEAIGCIASVLWIKPSYAYVTADLHIYSRLFLAKLCVCLLAKKHFFF